MIEKIEFHGGPRHGSSLDIPENYGNEIEVSVPAKKGDVIGSRLGHYTRVHMVGGVRTADFEWAGYTEPFCAEPVQS